jgi:hypothetical protein
MKNGQHNNTYVNHNKIFGENICVFAQTTSSFYKNFGA